MNTNTTRRLRFAAAGVLASAALMGSLGTASAAPSEAAAAASSARATSFYLPYAGTSGMLPSWGWGATKICVSNQGGHYAAATFQSGVAAPEYLYPGPWRTVCASRWFFGAPVTVTNIGSQPLVATGY